MTGLEGLEFTSADGAQLRFTPHAAKPAAEFVGDGLGELHVVDGAERVVAREGRPGAHLQAGDVTALLVDGDQDVVPFGAQLGGQRGQLIGRCDVAAEQADGGEAFTEAAQQPVRSRGPGEAGLEHGQGVARQGVL